MPPRLESIKIKGYRPFRDFKAKLGTLEVLVGANGTGKSSLFEFLMFIRDGVTTGIPPEIVVGAIGQNVFHNPGPEDIEWTMLTTLDTNYNVSYAGALCGPIGRIMLDFEELKMRDQLIQSFYSENIDTLDRKDKEDLLSRDQIFLLSSNVYLRLNEIERPVFRKLNNFVRNWKCFSSFGINRDKIRRSVVIEQEPVLREDCGNLSSVLHYLMSEHQNLFIELQQYMRLLVPGFNSLSVKARGGPGEVIAFWQEKGMDVDLSLADLSDGILRLLCWITLCIQPNLPTLICVDEPDQGVHPRTLPLLAGLFKKASERTQVLLATHSSYFLTQFDIEHIAVMRKEDGEIRFLKPNDSKILREQLADFGPQELEALHRSDELEQLS